MIAATLYFAIAFPNVDLSALEADVLRPAKNYYQKGIEHQPACTNSEIRRLRSEVLRAAQNHSPQQAWNLAFTRMCGTSRESNKYLQNHAPKLLSYGELTGAPGHSEDGLPRTLKKREELTLLRGSAWDVRVRRVKSSLIFYHTDGFCSSSFTLRKNGKNWLLVDFADSCD